MASFTVDGLEELQKQFNEMEEDAKKAAQRQEVPFSDLFTPAFMLKNTQFSTFDELMDAGGFHAETSEEFDAIPEETLDSHISSTTKFKSWEDMLDEATEQYLVKKLDV